MARLALSAHPKNANNARNAKWKWKFNAKFVTCNLLIHEDSWE